MIFFFFAARTVNLRITMDLQTLIPTDLEEETTTDLLAVTTITRRLFRRRSSCFRNSLELDGGISSNVNSKDTSSFSLSFMLSQIIRKVVVNRLSINPNKVVISVFQFLPSLLRVAARQSVGSNEEFEAYSEEHSWTEAFGVRSIDPLTTSTTELRGSCRKRQLHSRLSFRSDL